MGHPVRQSISARKVDKLSIAGIPPEKRLLSQTEVVRHDVGRVSHKVLKLRVVLMYRTATPQYALRHVMYHNTNDRWALIHNNKKSVLPPCVVRFFNPSHPSQLPCTCPSFSRLATN
jgi:hypothetical protein